MAGSFAESFADFGGSLAAALASLPLAAFSGLPFSLEILVSDGCPSPSAASGSPCMSLRLCTSTRRASLNVISALLSDRISDTNPTPNLGCVTITLS